MPRIPQAQFDTTPSSRVGTANVQMGADPMGNVTKNLSNLAGAFAQLQDQQERTEAYTKANEAKQAYMQQKVQYAAALDSVDGSGMASYIDPTDDNPDVSKRRRIQRPIQEMYKEMVDSYEEQKKSIKGIPREDIAQELMRGYVGDDLLQLQLNTNKVINKKRESEVLNHATQNLELNLSSLTEALNTPNPNPEMVQLKLAQLENKTGREIANIGNIIGAENTSKLLKLKDRAYATTAQQILSLGMTEQNVKTADALVARIKDPAQRSLASVKLENAKRATAQHAGLSAFKSMSDLNQKALEADFLKDEDYINIVQTAEKGLNIYVDPKYSTITQEQKQAAATDLISTALAKRTLQEAIMNGETDLESPEMTARLEQEIQASGLDRRVAGIAESVRDMTAQKMQVLRGSYKENVMEVIRAKGIRGTEAVVKAHQIAAEQGFGDPTLVTKREQSEFKNAFMTAMAKSPDEALNIFNAKIMDAGDAYEGEDSYRRAMAIDLAGKEPSLAFLIPMADADILTQSQMIQDAAVFKKIVAETDAKQTHFQQNFEQLKGRVPALTNLMYRHPSLYDGIKQSIFHRAATKVRGKDDVPSAIKSAIEEMGEVYTSVGSGASSFLAVNRKNGGMNYGQVETRTLELGLSKAATLPAMSDDEKFGIIKDYMPQLLPKNDKNEPIKIAREQMDYLLQRSVTIEPDGRFPNMHVVKINGIPVSQKGKILKLDAKSIMSYGLEQEKKYETDVWRRR